MAVRIPQNKIQYNYTSGKEYINEKTHEEYQGHYYKFNGKIFAGKEFNSNAPVLIPIPKDNRNVPLNFNKLLTQAATYVYGRISGKKISGNIPLSFIYNYESNIRYFTHHVNKKQIKEISKDTFDSLQNNPNPLYNTIKLNFISGFDELELTTAEQKIPGIREFVNTSYTKPPEDGLENEII